MPEGIAFFDILIFAVIAIFLGLRLHSALGKRTGFEQKKTVDHHLLLGHQAREKAARMKKPAQDKDKDKGDGAEDGAAGAEPELPMSGEGIPAIKKADAGFNESQFLNGAKAAYRAILGAFAKGDIKTLRPLLGYELQGSFADAIRGREAAREALTIQLDKLESAKIESAILREGLAIITVAFSSRQRRVLRAEDGNILEGNEKEAVSFSDLWTFERDVASPDPNWLLVETQTKDG